MNHTFKSLCACKASPHQQLTKPGRLSVGLCFLLVIALASQSASGTDKPKTPTPHAPQASPPRQVSRPSQPANPGAGGRTFGNPGPGTSRGAGSSSPPRQGAGKLETMPYTP